jgi:hypothetical protein
MRILFVGVTRHRQSDVRECQQSWATDGNDTVMLTEGSSFGANAGITLGDRMNTVTAHTVAVAGDLKIKTGAGDDTITLTNATVGGTTKIDSGGGTDTVTP